MVHAAQGARRGWAGAGGAAVMDRREEMNNKNKKERLGRGSWCSCVTMQ